MDKITNTLTGAQARRKILAGINAIYDTVKLTLGPEGKNGILSRTYNRGPRITNDGVTISDNIRPLDDHERQAAIAFHEGSKKTNELVGDGTTSTAVVGGHSANKIFKAIPEQDVPSAGISTKKGIRAIRKEMKDAKDLIISEVKKRAKPIKALTDLEKIAVVSIGKEDEEAAKVVAKLVWEVGRDATGKFIDNHIDVVEGYKGGIEVEVVKGNRFPAKIAHRAFINRPERFEMVADDVAVFITNYKLDNPYQVAGLLNKLKVAKIALFAPDFSPMVIKTLIETTKNGLFCYPIKCAALRTEQLMDLAAYTGANLIDKDMSGKIENATSEDLGFAEKIVVKDTENKDDAVLLGGKGEKIKRGQGNLITERIEVLKGQLKESKNELSKIVLNKRIANLSSAVGVIRVGATTEGESLYLKLKIEDGVYACKAALEEGYVEGGGLCLKKIADELPENILSESIREPYMQIQKNAGGVLEINKEIIDPAKVVRLVVEHGVSIASTLITADISIAEVREMSPAEGYMEVAKAINNFTRFQMKQHGMLKENEEYIDDMHNRAFDEALLSDKG